MQKLIFTAIILCILCGCLCSCRTNLADVTQTSSATATITQGTVTTAAKTTCTTVKPKSHISNSLIVHKSDCKIKRTVVRNNLKGKFEEGTDAKGNSFIFRDEKVVEYFANTDNINEQKKIASKEKILSLAKDIVVNEMALSVDGYLELASLDASETSWNVSFKKVFNGICSNDSVYLAFSAGGEILSWGISDYGCSNNIKIPNFDIDKVDKKFLKQTNCAHYEDIKRTLYFDQNKNNVSMQYIYGYSKNTSRTPPYWSLGKVFIDLN